MRHDDCGCGAKTMPVDFAVELGDPGEAPTLQEMERTLSEVAGEADGFDLELADLESALGEAEWPFLIDDSDTVTLGSIVAIAERYPGLKITFSF